MAQAANPTSVETLEALNQEKLEAYDVLGRFFSGRGLGNRRLRSTTIRA